MMPQPPRPQPSRKIIEACPTCDGPLVITEVRCESCGTEVRSHYQPCPFCRLTPEQTTFVLLFFQTRGNLSELEKALGVSYPTIRGKLDEVIRTIAAPVPTPPPPPDSGREILARVAAGRLSPTSALTALRQARIGRSSADRPADESAEPNSEHASDHVS
jgi:hypothetical protein